MAQEAQELSCRAVAGRRSGTSAQDTCEGAARSPPASRASPTRAPARSPPPLAPHRRHGPRRERRRRQQRREECHDMLQRGQVPRQQQWHEHGMPGERQSCLHVQDERQVRRPATVATAARAGSRRGRRLARGEATTRDDRAGHHGRGTMCGRRDCGATGSRSNTSARRRADTECPVTMGVAMLEARRGLSGRSTVIGARHAAGATRRGSLGAGGSGAAAAAAEFLVPGRRPRPQRLEGSSPRRGRRPRHRERERQRASYAAISAMSSA